MSHRNCHISPVRERKPHLSRAGSRTPFQVLGGEREEAVCQI